MKKANYDSALSFASAIDKFIQGKKDRIINSTLIQCSSITADLIPENEYGEIKKRTDDDLLVEGKYDNINHILCFRIGYVVQSLILSGKINKGHYFGIEQLARYFPLQPVIVYHDGGKSDNVKQEEFRNREMIYPGKYFKVILTKMPRSSKGSWKMLVSITSNYAKQFVIYKSGEKFSKMMKKSVDKTLSQEDSSKSKDSR